MILPEKVTETASVIAQQEVAPDVFRMELSSPAITKLAKPGQFVQVRILNGDHILRRPLGIAECDRTRGTFSLFYRIVGSGTRDLSLLVHGENVNVLGPLGHGFDVSFQHPLLVGGGMGLSPLLSYAQAKRGACDILMGGKNASELFWQSFYAPYVEKTILTTDDGSLGSHGFTTTVFPDIVKQETYDGVLVCGPEIMMRGIARLAKAAGLPCQVSLEKRMACGLGACLSCSIDTVNGARKKVCKDGPVFWAEEVFA